MALLACGSAYWPLAFEPSAMTNRHPHYCGHPHCRGHPPGGTVAGGGGLPWENFAVKKGGEIAAWRNVGGTVSHFATAAGIVSSESFGDFTGGEIVPGRTPPPLHPTEMGGRAGLQTPPSDIKQRNNSEDKTAMNPNTFGGRTIVSTATNVQGLAQDQVQGPPVCLVMWAGHPSKCLLATVPLAHPHTRTGTRGNGCLLRNDPARHSGTRRCCGLFSGSLSRELWAWCAVNSPMHSLDHRTLWVWSLLGLPGLHFAPTRGQTC